MPTSVPMARCSSGVTDCCAGTAPHAGRKSTTSNRVEALPGGGGGDTDLRETRAAIDHLAAVPVFVMHEVWLLRLRALLAEAHGDDAAYAPFQDRYRDMARSLGFEGHIAWAEAMT
jgi:adenylate cyclase